MSVDTGRARAGWHTGISGLHSGYANRFNWSKDVKTTGTKGIPEGKAKGSFKSNLTGNNKYVELINGVDYIVFLEYGYSKQAPAGMVRIALEKMRGQMPNLISDEFLTNWNKM